MPDVTKVRDSADSQLQHEERTSHGGSRDPAGVEANAVDEERRSGPFNLRSLSKFVHAGTGVVLATLVVVTSALYLALFLERGFWIASSTRMAPRPPTELSLVVNTNAYDNAGKLQGDSLFHLKIYLMISVFMCLVSTLRYFVLLKANINASRHLFDRMLTAVTSIPRVWFDTVPIGRVINKFTTDFQSIDSNLGKNLGSATSGMLQTLGIVLAAALAIPAMIVPAIVLLTTSAAVFHRYLTAAREIKRLEALARSTVLELLLSVTAGLATIRGFGRVACYVDKMYQAVDRRSRALWYLSLFNAWLGFRLNVIGAAFATLAALLIVGTRSVDASLSGFALSFVLQLTAATDFMIHGPMFVPSG